MAKLVDFVEALIRETKTRPATSDGEHQAAQFIAQQFEDSGLDTVMQEFTCARSAWWLRIAYNLLAAIAAYLLFFVPDAAPTALFIVILALAMLALDVLGINPVGKFFDRGLSQNVVARYIPNTSTERRRKIVFVAHYDAGRSKVQAAPPIANNYSIVRYVMWGALGVLLVLAIVFMLRFLPEIVFQILGYVALLIGVIVLVALIFELVNLIMPYNQGANSNASGVATLVGIADRIVEEGGAPRRRERTDSDDALSAGDGLENELRDDRTDVGVGDIGVPRRRNEGVVYAREARGGRFQGELGAAASDAAGAGARAAGMSAAGAGALGAGAAGAGAAGSGAAGAIGAAGSALGGVGIDGSSTGRVRARQRRNAGADDHTQDFEVPKSLNDATSENPAVVSGNLSSGELQPKSAELQELLDRHERGQESPARVDDMQEDLPSAQQPSQQAAQEMAQERPAEAPAAQRLINKHPSQRSLEPQAAARRAAQQGAPQAAAQGVAQGVAQGAQGVAQGVQGGALQAAQQGAQQGIGELAKNAAAPQKRTSLADLQNEEDRIAWLEAQLGNAKPQEDEDMPAWFTKAKKKAAAKESAHARSDEAEKQRSRSQFADVPMTVEEAEAALASANANALAGLSTSPSAASRGTAGTGGVGGSTGAGAAGATSTDEAGNVVVESPLGIDIPIFDIPDTPSNAQASQDGAGAAGAAEGAGSVEAVAAAGGTLMDSSKLPRLTDPNDTAQGVTAQGVAAQSGSTQKMPRQMGAVDMSGIDKAAFEVIEGQHAPSAVVVPAKSDNDRTATADALTAAYTGTNELNAGQTSEISAGILPDVLASTQASVPEEHRRELAIPRILPGDSGSMPVQQAVLDEGFISLEDFGQSADSSVNITGSFAALGATGTMKPVGEELLDYHHESEDIYIADVDDSHAAASFDDSASYAPQPQEIDIPQSRARSFFGGLGERFGGRRKRDNFDESPRDWLGVDEGFDARREGNAIGTWENFAEGGADDWKGGAYGGGSFADNAQAIRSFSSELLDKEIWLVALGAHEEDNAGMENLLEAYSSELRNSFIVNLDSIGAGELCYTVMEGSLFKSKTDHRLQGLVQSAARAIGLEIAPAVFSACETSATKALKKGARAISIMGLGKEVPPGWRWLDNRPSLISEGAIQETVDLAVEMVKSS
ncbi:MAG: hypothetical protein LBB42_00475 [Coriobacteriales bacterium]|jgi:hypothetical protein|nr:hypothetical protein [Coriobacteriales bacterium]